MRRLFVGKEGKGGGLLDLATAVYDAILAIGLAHSPQRSKGLADILGNGGL